LFVLAEAGVMFYLLFGYLDGFNTSIETYGLFSSDYIKFCIYFYFSLACLLALLGVFGIISGIFVNSKTSACFLYG